MNNQPYQGAYSRRRFSNYAINQTSADNTGLHMESHGDINLKKVTLKVSWNGAMGRVTGSGNYTVETATPPCQASATVIPGTTVTLTATPDAGYHFEGWRGAPVEGVISQSVNIKVSNNLNVSAVFAPDTPGEHPSDNPTGGNGGEPPVSVGGNGNGGNGNGNGNGGNHTNGLYGGSFVNQKLIPFVRQWWWAILIVAYIAYKEWKGAGK